MVEIPSVALLAGCFAQLADFFSISTNDLTQYTLTAERGNKRVAHLSDPCHPAVLKEIELVIQVAHHHGKWVEICCEIAGDEEALPLLVGLGMDELSMAPGRPIPRAKQIIRSLSLPESQALTREVATLEDAAVVRQVVRSRLFSERPFRDKI